MCDKDLSAYGSKPEGLSQPIKQSLVARIDVIEEASVTLAVGFIGPVHAV